MLLKGTRTGVLATAALDLLSEQVQDEGCCPVCCSMCWVLDDMAKSGDLDQVVRKAPYQMYEGKDWWDDRQQVVRVSWLKSAWPANRGCHSEDEEEGVDTATAAA